MRSKRNFVIFYTCIISATSAIVVLSKFAPSYPTTLKAAFGFLLMIVWAGLCSYGGAILIWRIWGKSHQLPQRPTTKARRFLE
jgi:hypothetical protein